MSKVVYAAVTNGKEKLKIAIRSATSFDVSQIDIKTDVAASLISFLSNYQKNNNKIRAIGVNLSDELWEEVYPKLWLELDISPFKTDESDVKKAADWVRKKFADDNSYIAQVNKNRKVVTHPLVGLADYEKITPPDLFDKLLGLSKKFDKKIIYISATPQGGGVAIMRHAMMRLANLLDIDMSWYVLKDDPDVFDITKRKFHNVLQNIADAPISLTEDEKKVFLKWSRDNYKLLKKPIEEADVVVIDDPQPAGIIKFIKKDFGDKPIVYRSHIHLFASLADKDKTSQNITWQFLWQFIKEANLFISHPKEEFVPKSVDPEKLIYSPPSTDRLDGLNKELTQEQMEYYMQQLPIDYSRPYIVQIARFDPSKGIMDVLEAYRKVVNMCHKDNKPIPQLVIAGNSSVDDPDGVPIFNAVTQKLETDDFRDLREDIKVIRLPHYDQLLNTLLRRSYFALQLSHREGFEFKITEAIWKGKPVVIYDAGGMDLQVEHGKTGYIAKTGDIDEAAKYMYKLFDKDIYDTMSKNALNAGLLEFSTVGNMIDWLTILPLALKR